MTDHNALARRIAEKAVDQRWMIERMDSEEAPMYMDRLVAIIARELREALPTSETITDTDRLRFLAGCGSDDGPPFEGVIQGHGRTHCEMPDDYYVILIDMLAADPNDYSAKLPKPTDDQKLEALRMLVDRARGNKS